MLPIYKAIEVIEIISENVGHTKPWVVLVNTPKGLKPYVTKLYSTSQVDQTHCVSKEVICNILAGEFELKAPTCALIYIPDELALQLPMAAQMQYSSIDHRLKFATLMIDNVTSAIPGLPKSHYNRRISLDTLYAFDNFIRNCDRGNPKSNLLVSSQDAFLIDHELALSKKDIDVDIQAILLEDKFTKYHLFYPYLEKTSRNYRQSLFDEFAFYLNSLNLNILSTYFNQLVKEGFNDYSQPIFKWLEQVKQNESIFVNKLKGSLL